MYNKVIVYYASLYIYIKVYNIIVYILLQIHL